MMVPIHSPMYSSIHILKKHSLSTSPWVFGDKQDEASPSKTFEIQWRRQTGTQRTITQRLEQEKGVE